MFRRFTAVLAAALTTLTVGAAVTTAQATAAENDPVVIVAGTFGPAAFYEPLAARLRHDGYDVSIFQLTNLGAGDIAATARDLASFVDGVKSDTGASKVDMIGHSQGGLVLRQYIRFAGGESTVDSAISLSAPHYGTAIADIAKFFTGGNCFEACVQMAQGSDFVNALNEGDDTPGSARYTNFYTDLDELVRPVENAALKDGADNVKIQSQCPFRPVAHVGMATDGTVYSGIHQALQGQSIDLNCTAV